MKRKSLFTTLITLTLILMFGTIVPNALATKLLIGFTQQPGPAEQALVRNAGGTIKYTYHIIPSIAATVDGGAIAGLLADPRVTHVHPDGRVQALDAELDNSWGVKRIGAGTVHAYNKGTGVKVAIIDTGIDYTHEDLDANYKGGYDFVNSDTDPMDDHGHGTHVAGSAAAEDNDDDTSVVGVAPEAALYALKVLDETGSGYWSDVIAALQWSVDNGMQVVNMSLGGTGTSDVEAACQAAYDAGILLVAAAGNDGNPPGKGDNISDPAGYASVIAVGATDSNDSRAKWSSTGPDLELMAPGVDINSTLLGGGYGEKSGTSMASPHVAGTAALVMIAYPLWTNADVRTQLQNTADDLGDPGFDTKYGYGLVDADEAAPPTDSTPPAKVTGLTVTTISCAQLDLAWDANTETDLDHYNVYRSTASGGSYDLIASPTTNSYSDTGLTASTTYYYVVSAVDTSGNEGEASSEASGTTTADDLGPVTSNVVADPNPTNGATSVTLTADVSDSTTGNSNIAAAEYFVGTVGADGSGTPMSASDSAFDSPTEAVTASIDVSGWAVGLYTLYVHGQDAAGNWGATESVVLDVTTEPTEPTTVSVSSIDYATTGGRNNDLHLLITVALVDDLGNPVPDASVSIRLDNTTTGQSWTGTGTTGTDGTVTFKLTNAPDGCYTTTVTDVTAEGLTWDGITPENGFCKGDSAAPARVNLSSEPIVEGPIFELKLVSSTVVKVEKTVLRQNYPNPFNPETWIPFTLSDQRHVVISIYNVTGQLVRTLDLGSKQAGAYVPRDKAAYWNGKNQNGEKVSSGVYFYLMEAGSFRAMKKMVIMK